MHILASEGFGINSNILETNLINLIIVLVLLVNFTRGFLGKLLSARLHRIESALKDAEARQAKAKQDLESAQAQLTQAEQEAQRIIQEAQQSADVARNAILAGVEEDIAKLQAAADQEIASERSRVVKQLRRQLVEQALQATQSRLDQGLSASAQHQLVDRSLSLLSR
jgi:F-type H+-transporting ATPase subunit b